MTHGSVGKAALMGGVLAGLVSGIPIVGALNLLCCAWGVAGGLFAAWVVSSDSQGTASGARRLAAGLLSGLVAGPLSLVTVSLVQRLTVGEEALMVQLEKELQSQGPSPVPAELLEEIVRGMILFELNAFTFVSLIVAAVVFAFFGLLGGALGAAVTRRAPLPVVPPPSAPATQPDAGAPAAPPSPPEPSEQPPAESRPEPPRHPWPEPPDAPASGPPGRSTPERPTASRGGDDDEA